METRGGRAPKSGAEWLQWGHAFVSVETVLAAPRLGAFDGASMGPRFCKRGNPMCCGLDLIRILASMGPRFCKRGNKSPSPTSAPPGAASMGPRFCKRGNGWLRALPWRQREASMGPRFCKRGNSVAQYYMRPNPFVLQWGHAFVSVETPRVGFLMVR